MAAQDDVSGSASSLLSAARAADGSPGGPPVDKWDPPYCGEIDIRIARDGTWFHEGTPIGRIGLVKLFASILKREEGRHFLVTPVEKVGITVEDAPFIALDHEAGDGEIALETNLGDRVVAGPDHPIRVEMAPDGEPAPYVMVRRGLEALIDRKTFYRLVELGEERDGQFGLVSRGEFFPMIAAAELP